MIEHLQRSKYVLVCGRVHYLLEVGYLPAILIWQPSDTTMSSLLGQTSQSCQKRKRENNKRKKCQQHRISESCNIPQPLRPPNNSTALLCHRIAAYQATSSRRTVMT